MIVVRIKMNVHPEKQKKLVQTILSMTGPMEKEWGWLNDTEKDYSFDGTLKK